MNNMAAGITMQQQGFFDDVGARQALVMSLNFLIMLKLNNRHGCYGIRELMR